MPVRGMLCSEFSLRCDWFTIGYTMERHSCLMLLHFVLFFPKSVLLCIKEVLACQHFMGTYLNEVLLVQIFILSCQNVVLTCLNTVLLFQNVMLSWGNPVLTCRMKVLICLTCMPSFRIKISLCLNKDLFKCGVELFWNCLMMWNSSVILSEVGVILCKCDPGMLWHCCIMLYCRFVLSKCNIDLCKHRHILSDCQVIVFKFGVILLKDTLPSQLTEYTPVTSEVSDSGTFDRCAGE
jgi:hypothetical protein